jgi:hypothetical protein
MYIWVASLETKETQYKAANELGVGVGCSAECLLPHTPIIPDYRAHRNLH